MASLRARVLACVLLLAAAGLIALAAVTYAEQRSFLEGQVDQEVKAAVPAMSQLLDNKGYDVDDRGNPTNKPPSEGSFPGTPPGRQPGGQAPQANVPPGTFGERRAPGGRVVGKKELFSYNQTKPAEPVLPAQIEPEKLITVGSKGGSGLKYRVWAERDSGDPGITIAAVPLSSVSQTLSRLLLVEALVIAGVLAALGASALFVVRLGLRPLDRIGRTAAQIAAGDLARRVSPATSRTEVGRLGLALNAMLDRLERAFQARIDSEERLRRFLSDASHELRTPLASIRGYAELYRMGAASDREGTELAMRRIEEESARMGVLVEDLLLLARLDESPDREPVQVDLAALARDAAGDARATAPDRRIELDGPDSLEVRGDPLQLRQVFANLLRNALVHTPAGTAIEIALRPRDGSVEILVRDHGPGIPAEARKRLFERFWRAEGGRERGRAGAGLGLAIVHSIVEGHGGSVRAEEAAGGGAMFVVTLPRAGSPSAAL